eukprot:TRINITY_DN64306_c0_g1_i1.p1 TRINITY_DN64306_c0_g1~~TRINITY_DN64306_c0_g1_i1.p1  ORF type:complete len:175 (+),score=19.39 TRINITY_DN64306_c0_g1_i1:65-589(+)
MFACRLCSQLPFDDLFGMDTAKKGKFAAKEDGLASRSFRETQTLVRRLKQHVRPRAHDFFGSEAAIELILYKIVAGTNRRFNLLLGPKNECVNWNGDVTEDDQQPCLSTIQPGESEESVGYVNRVLIFLFATDDEFERRMQFSQEPFKMSCGNQLCVHFRHITAFPFSHDALIR